jgi:polyisoprenoid-binding protein YceI
MMKKLFIAAAIATSLMAPLASAADYVIDNKGAHASINFKIQHLGYSWLTGRFDTFGGKFSYDQEDVSASKIEVNIDTSSVNSNHAERDKHLKSDDFLEVDKFANAKFVSSSVVDKGDDKLEIKGTLTLHGVSKEIVIEANKVGEGDDPWGGYRVGFSGTTKIGLKDFAIKMDLGPASSHVELELHIEGIKVK